MSIGHLQKNTPNRQIDEMDEKTRGEQRFAAITYSQLARWTGLKLSTVQSYGSHGHIPKESLVKTLQWVARYCHDQRRPEPWQMHLNQQDRFSRELGFWCYKDYLKSDLWQEIRSRILPCKCRKCGVEAECVHHHRYTIDNTHFKRVQNSFNTFFFLFIILSGALPWLVARE